MTEAAAGEVQGRAERLARWTSAYRPQAGVPDEFMDADGRPKGAWPRFLDRLGALDELEIGARFVSAVRRIRDTGISYRIYGDKREHAWPLGSLPLVIEQDDWEALSAGIVERAGVMESILADIYGDGRLVAQGLLPAAAVAGSPEFMRPLVGVTPPGGRFLKLYAADVTRGPDGRWRVLADRTQSPSGPGYALENRLVLTRAFPDLHADLQVERLAAFFQAFRDGLAVGAERSDPRICLLTSGVFSSTYVEQAALARYLGLLLVEGDDLVMQDGALHIRTVSGLKRADVLWRRIDSDYIDPSNSTRPRASACPASWRPCATAASSSATCRAPASSNPGRSPPICRTSPGISSGGTSGSPARRPGGAAIRTPWRKSATTSVP